MPCGGRGSGGRAGERAPVAEVYPSRSRRGESGVAGPRPRGRPWRDPRKGGGERRAGRLPGGVPAPAGIPGRGPQSFSRGRRQSRDGPCVRLVQPSLSVSSGGGLEPLLGLTRFTTLVRSY